MRSILIVEDDITYSMMLKAWLGKKGFQVTSVSSIARAQKQLETESIDLILSDLRLPDKDGIYLLQWLDMKGVDIPLIIMTGYADIQSAVQAIKLGASDYVSKPVNPDELLKKINEAIRIPETISEKQKENSSPPDYLEGESDVAKELYNYVRLVAPTNMSVLINGASGTGKEYVAQRIHQLSKRANQPFIAIDCGAIPTELAASELFGHVKGAFTDALTDKTGAFVAANGGTIFLDEIGNLSYEIQVQLLRALQERKVRPVGSNSETSLDIRLVSATNEKLEEAISKGTFREDLFHRINEFSLSIPLLKDRKEDILLFANLFLDQANNELGKQLVGFEPAASKILLTYQWPGNLREMRNVIRRATLLATSKFITCDELATLQENKSVLNMNLYNEKTEKQQIIEALQQTGNNKSRAAQLLGIDRKTLYNKLKLYQIEL